MIFFCSGNLPLPKRWIGGVPPLSKKIKRPKAAGVKKTLKFNFQDNLGGEARLESPGP